MLKASKMADKIIEMADKIIDMKTDKIVG